VNITLWRIALLLRLLFLKILIYFIYLKRQDEIYGGGLV